MIHVRGSCPRLLVLLLLGALLCAPLVDAAPSGGSPAIAGPAKSSGGIQVSVAGDPTEGAAPLATNLSAFAAGGFPPYNFSWDLGEGTSAYGAQVAHLFPRAGTFTASVNVTDRTGQQVHAFLTIRVTARLTLAVRLSANATRPGSGVTVQGDPTGGCGILSYVWTLNRTVPLSAGAALTYYPRTQGNYTFSLAVQDACGHRADGSVVLEVLPPLPAVTVENPSWVSVLGLALGIVLFLGALVLVALYLRRQRGGKGEVRVSLAPPGPEGAPGQESHPPGTLEAISADPQTPER